MLAEQAKGDRVLLLSLLAVLVTAGLRGSTNFRTVMAQKDNHQGNLLVTGMASYSSESLPFPSGHRAKPHCSASLQPCHLRIARTDFHRQQKVRRRDCALLSDLEGSIWLCLLLVGSGWEELCLTRSETLWTQEGGLDAQ